MDEINGILMMTMLSLLLAFQLKPGWPRWLRRLVGLAAVAAAVPLLLWEVRVPMAVWLHDVLVFGSGLLCIALGLWTVVRGEPGPAPPPQ